MQAVGVTPRVNGQLARQYTNQVVRLVGRVLTPPSEGRNQARTFLLAWRICTCIARTQQRSRSFVPACGSYRGFGWRSSDSVHGAANALALSVRRGGRSRAAQWPMPRRAVERCVRRRLWYAIVRNDST